MPIQGNGGHAKVVRELVFTPVDGLIVAIGNNAARKCEAEKASNFAIGIHPTAIISPSATIGTGTVIMAGAVIQAGARIGEHCIVNTGATVDHDCLVENYVHLAPNSTLCGAVTVHEGAFVGAGATCVQGARVPPWALVKAGTVFKSKEWLENYKERLK